MFNLKTLSFIIPFYYDTMDRLENLDGVLHYLQRHFYNYSVVLIESGPTPKARSYENFAGVRYVFEPSSHIFHRTRLLNQAAEMADSPYLCFHDCDALIEPKAIEESLQNLCNDEAFIIPYNGTIIDVRDALRAQVLKELSIPELPLLNRKNSNKIRHYSDLKLIPGYRHLGAMIFMRSDIFLRWGGYNENMVSWGEEDVEIVYRFKSLGYPPKRLNHYNLFHLHHRRLQNSARLQNPYYSGNLQELKKVKRFNGDELRSYIDSELKVEALVHYLTEFDSVRLNPFRNQTLTPVVCPHCQKAMDVKVHLPRALSYLRLRFIYSLKKLLTKMRKFCRPRMGS